MGSVPGEGLGLLSSGRHSHSMCKHAHCSRIPETRIDVAPATHEQTLDMQASKRPGSRGILQVP